MQDVLIFCSYVSTVVVHNVTGFIYTHVEQPYFDLSRSFQDNKGRMYTLENLNAFSHQISWCATENR